MNKDKIIRVCLILNVWVAKCFSVFGYFQEGCKTFHLFSFELGREDCGVFLFIKSNGKIYFFYLIKL